MGSTSLIVKYRRLSLVHGSLGYLTAEGNKRILLSFFLFLSLFRVCDTTLKETFEFRTTFVDVFTSF